MDALDARILRELGMEPFARPHAGLRVADVARVLGVGHQLVKDRIAKMTETGVIIGYKIFPNLRHLGLTMTVQLMRTTTVPSLERLAPLKQVDGLARVIWSLDSQLCIEMVHANEAERQRRIQLVQHLSKADGPAKVLYSIALPEVQHELSPLDWRILHALIHDAKRPTADVARQLGVTDKTVRTRLATMRRRGSFDEYVEMDLSKVNGIIPFQLALWATAGMDPREDLLARFQDRLLASFTPPGNGHCAFLLRIFAYTPPEVQCLVTEALAVPGVERAEPLMATGGITNDAWLTELMEHHVPVLKSQT